MAEIVLWTEAGIRERHAGHESPGCTTCIVLHLLDEARGADAAKDTPAVIVCGTCGSAAVRMAPGGILAGVGDRARVAKKGRGHAYLCVNESCRGARLDLGRPKCTGEGD